MCAIIHTLKQRLREVNIMQHQVYIIHYKYKNKRYTSETKSCSYAEALDAFNTELNSIGSFKLVKIVPAVA